MAYIGTQPLAGQYRKLDNISSGFNGTNTSFTTSVGGINVTAGSPQQLLVSLGGVIQQPITDYTVNTSVIIFTTAPSAGLDFFAILMGDALNTSVPADGSVTSAKLAGSLNIGLGAGSVSTPSLFFSGDANTGIYSPGADQVAVATNVTGRLFIDSSGRLLVGTSTARSNFFGTTLSSLTQTEGTGGAAGRGALSVINNDVSNNPPYVLLGRSGAATLGSNAAVVSGSRLGTLTFHGADGTSFIEAATVAGEVDGTPGTNDMPGRLVFSTTADGAASPTERMRITSAGLVGVGTTSPGAPLDVVGNSNTVVLSSNATDATTKEAKIQCRHYTNSEENVMLLYGYSTSTTNELYIGGGSSSQNALTNIIFSTSANNTTTSGSERMRITSAGLVGIGTSSPGSLLHAAGKIRFGSNASYYGEIDHDASSTGSNIYDHSDSGGHIFRNGGTERLRITSAGLVGIGTTSPATALHTVGTVRISRSDDAAQYLNLYSSAGEGFIDAVNSNSGINQPIIFRIGNNSATTERARIDASGRLLVGTSSSLDVNAGLQIAVNSSFSDFYPLQVFHFDSTDDTQGPTTIYTRSKSDTIGTVSAVNVNDGLGTILFRGAGTSTYVNGALIKAEVESGTVSNTSMPSRLVFSTTADGASSPTERMRISQNGKTDIYSSDYGLATRVSAAAGTSVAIYYGSYGATSTSTGTVSYQVLSNGNVQNTNNSYGAYSDIKLKENIVDANSQWNDLKALRVRNYNLKEGQTHTQIGLVAQEIEPISPGLIYETPDRDEDGNDLGTVTKSVNYSVLYMKAVKALQEAMERIEQLETEMAAVTAQLS